MTQELVIEITEMVEDNVKYGFENETELFQGIQDAFVGEEGFSDSWLRELICEKYKQHQLASLKWTTPTDFQRLAKSFDELIKQKIVCLHKAGYTLSDAECDCQDVVHALSERGIEAKGYCFYHTQDLERAINPEVANLLIGFDSIDQNDDDAILVAQKIVSILKKNGFDVSWEGTVKKRIEINKINWQKVPDNEDWGAQRVIEMMSSIKKEKPFWKFW